MGAREPRDVCGISIHALLAESDRFYPLKTLVILPFLSTLSLRRATIIRQHSEPDSSNFYPRSPCGERHPAKSESLTTYLISIHALLAESDPGEIGIFDHIFNFYPRSPCGERPLIPHMARLKARLFLSTLSLRRATTDMTKRLIELRISIHALLAESDSLMLSMAATQTLFLSTLSLRRATSFWSPY